MAGIVGEGVEMVAHDQRAELNTRQLEIYARELNAVFWAERQRSEELAEALERERGKARELEEANAALNGIQAKLRAAASGVITALAVALDQRDPYTEGHSQRVASYATLAAAELGLTAQQLEIVAYAAKAHDIGKIGIPDELLRKPGELTDEEWQLMREHPARSVAIIVQLDFLSKPGLDSIGQHHERLDGSGYPDGLSGDEICLGARLIAVADALDAMTTARPYQEVRSSEEAFRELRACAGLLFDSEVVAAMELGWQ